LIDAVRRAEVDILKYLLAHQEARDTVEGIEKWWLPEGQPYRRVDIETALLDLARLDLIRIWQSTSAQPIFGQGAADRRSLEQRLHSLE
jgi:hypothetical protein